MWQNHFPPQNHWTHMCSTCSGHKDGKKHQVPGTACHWNLRRSAGTPYGPPVNPIPSHVRRSDHGANLTAASRKGSACIREEQLGSACLKSPKVFYDRSITKQRIMSPISRKIFWLFFFRCHTTCHMNKNVHFSKNIAFGWSKWIELKKDPPVCVCLHLAGYRRSSVFRVWPDPRFGGKRESSTSGGEDVDSFQKYWDRLEKKHEFIYYYIIMFKTC